MSTVPVPENSQEGVQPLSYLDLYSEPRHPAPAVIPVREAYREVVPLEKEARAEDPEDPAPTPAPRKKRRPATAFEAFTGGLSLRSISPRDMADVSLELYAAGLLTYDEYEMLAFQPELHPDYDSTVGALTGETARPDEPRDFIDVWEERLHFLKRHNPENTDLVRSTSRIVRILIGMNAAKLPNAPETEAD